MKIVRGKKRRNEVKKQDRDYCEGCRNGCDDTAAVLIRGRIKWLCYDCYQIHKKRMMYV